MHFPFQHFSQKQIFLFILAGCLGVAAVAMTRNRLTTRALIRAPEGNEASSISLAPQQQRKTIEVVVVTLDPNGFFPREVILPKKKFVLAINNRAEKLTETTFELFREKTNKLQETKLKRETMSLQTVLDLPPGNYELRAQDNPTWVLSLIDKK